MKKFVLMISLLFLLLIFHKETISGTKLGLLLWYQTLIPSLLPFILITNALSETNAYRSAALYFQKYFPKKIYEFMAVVIGNLCGYPIGAKIINDFVNNHYISPKNGNRLLTLSSQTSPMFLIGYIHLHLLQNSVPLLIFLLSIYLPCFILYFLSNPKTTTETSEIISVPKLYIRDTFLHAIQIMVMIGVYIIIFSILLKILLPFCNHPSLKIALSFLEITNGLSILNSLSLPLPVKSAFLCALSSFGGLCSAMQIYGIISYSNADIKKYLQDKIILSAGTFFIIILYYYLEFIIH